MINISTSCALVLLYKKVSVGVGLEAEIKHEIFTF
jgi:hypothetical protein